MGQANSKKLMEIKPLTSIPVPEGYIIVELRDYTDEILESICIKLNESKITASKIYKEVSTRSQFIKSKQYQLSSSSSAKVILKQEPLVFVYCEQSEPIKANQTCIVLISPTLR